MTARLRHILRTLQCKLLQDHDWTCAAAEGVQPTSEQLTSGVDGFYDYAKMYCKRCGKLSEISRLAKERRNHERHAKNGSGSCSKADADKE